MEYEFQEIDESTTKVVFSSESGARKLYLFGKGQKFLIVILVFLVLSQQHIHFCKTTIELHLLLRSDFPLTTQLIELSRSV